MMFNNTSKNNNNIKICLENLVNYYIYIKSYEMWEFKKTAASSGERYCSQTHESQEKPDEPEELQWWTVKSAFASVRSCQK